MAYVPFDPSYSSLRTPSFVAAETSRTNAQRSWVGNAIDGGNALMGNLIANCACTNPAFGGQSYYGGDPTDVISNSLVPSGGAATATDPDTAALVAAASTYPLTPVDILTGTYGFPMRKDGRAWARPRLPGSVGRRRANSYPNLGPAFDTSKLVPPCPCFSSAAPVPITVPMMVPTPAPAPTPAAPAAPCPYPACSTGNVCLDLVTGCVLNSQIDPGQQQACALANYGVFGNRGTFLGEIIHSCPSPPYLGTPLPNPPQADPSMMALMNSKGLSGLGQTDGTSGVGGFVAILAMFGIVMWATKK
jgi:hypothetical protein